MSRPVQDFCVDELGKLHIRDDEGRHHSGPYETLDEAYAALVVFEEGTTMMNVWHPIETAPKDGTEILLSSADWNGDVVLSGWHFGAWRERADPEAETREPTVWMPLPSAPSSLDWVKIAKLAGQHGIRYPSNASMEAFLAAIDGLPSCTGVERDLLKLASDIHQLKPTPAATEEYYGGYLEGRNDAFQLVMEKADAANDAELFADMLDALQSMIAWGEEPEPGTNSVRERELCKVWAKARTAISKATA